MAMTQNQMVLNHLKNSGTLTRLEALRLYGISELNTRICNLRAAGHLIGSNSKSVKNKFGRKVSVSEYYLIREAESNVKNS